MSAPIFDPAGLGHPAVVTSVGWHRMNLIDPVGATAPGAFVTTAVSITAEPASTTPFGFEVLIRVTSPFSILICAVPDATAGSPDTRPNRDVRVRGKLVKSGSPGTGWPGTARTRRRRLTRQILVRKGPFAGPSVTVTVGVRATSPVTGSGTWMV